MLFRSYILCDPSIKDVLIEELKKEISRQFTEDPLTNAEQMIDYKTGEPHTAHTTNPVPIVLVTDHKEYKLKESGKLADLAPTMLDLMGLQKPEEMTGESLLIKE